jgi:hypothetical protein
VAFVELNWGAGANIVRVGQFHNLLLPMIAGSASHIGTPLGYGAGQLGWRSPGITYLHRFPLSASANLDAGLQINRNSWIDNFAPCAPGTAPPVTPNCLPSGVSLGEASGWPQFEARAQVSGGKPEAPLPFYYPNAWQFYLVGHWDQKDLSGIGGVAMPPAMGGPAPRDSMQSLIGQVGFKVQFGPVLVAGNGWYGKNAGGVYGHIIQMQLPNMPDVNGFGGWGQIGFGITKQLSVWGFGGIDKPNQAQAIAAGFTRVQNVQLSGMLAYSDGPVIVALEYLNVGTDNVLPATMATASAPAMASRVARFAGNQISGTVAYTF